MKLDQLPTEMLVKIFSYVPAYRELLRVNKRFYGIACDMNDSNICVRIRWQYFEFILSNNMSSYRCFQNLNRQITKLQIGGENENEHCPIKDERWIIDAVKKFSPTIKTMQLANLVMDESTLMEILSLVPNIEFLEFNRVVLRTLSRSSAKRRCDDDLNLKKLYKLWIVGCNYYSADIFNRLPAGVLTVLRLKTFNWNTLVALLHRQSNIKNLSLESVITDGLGLATDIFDDLRLESLQLDVINMDNATLTAILSKNKKLKSLHLTRRSDSAVDEHVINAITDLMELGDLTMHVKRIPASSFVKIRKLEKLQDLTLQCYGIDGTAVKILAGTVNTSIQELRLWCEAMPMDTIAALAKSVPSLKRFEPTRYRTPNRTELDAYMQHFNFIEGFHIKIGDEPLLNAGNYDNPNLRELIISDKGRHPYFYKWLPKFSASYPNLKKLKLTALCPQISLQIAPILNGFPKLESLIIRAVRPAIKDDLDYLCVDIGNLKFVSFGYIEDWSFFGRLAMKFNCDYGFVCQLSGDVLNVAVDRYTLYCKYYA